MSSARRFEPSGSMRYPRIWPPSRSELNTIVDPSGDQSGPQSLAGSLVMLRRSEPSAAATKISSFSLMPRVESRYTTHSPSGDQPPSNSGPPGSAATFTTFEPSTSMTKTSSKSSNTIRPDSMANWIGSPDSTGAWPMWTIRVGRGAAVGESDALPDELGAIGPAQDASTPAIPKRSVRPFGRRMPPLRLPLAPGSRAHVDADMRYRSHKRGLAGQRHMTRSTTGT